MHGKKIRRWGSKKKTRERNIWRREQQRGTNSKGERNIKFDQPLKRSIKEKRAAQTKEQQSKTGSKGEWISKRENVYV